MYNHQDINFNFLIKIYHKRKVQLIIYKNKFTKYYNYQN